MSRDPSIWSSTNPRLPVEICERVIDFFAGAHSIEGQISALYACSLTCRSWLPRSRVHLFYSVVLNDGTELSRILRSLRANPTNGTLIRRLVLWGEKKDETWVNSAVIQLSHYLRNVRSLNLSDTSFPNTHTIFFKALSQMKSVTDLSISTNEFTSLGQFMRLLLTFPRLSRLEIHEYVSWKDPRCGEHIVGQLRKKKLCLREFTTVTVGSNAGAIDLVRFLLGTPSAHALENVKFDFWQREGYEKDDLELECKGQLLKSASQSLRTLNLTIDHLGVKNLDLCESTNLTSLSLVWVGDSAEFISVLCELLPQNGSTCLEEITLGCAYEASVDWKPLDKVFSQPKFAHLTRVVIGTHYMGQDRRESHVQEEMGKTLDKWCTQLSHVNSRGILRLKHPLTKHIWGPRDTA